AIVIIVDIGKNRISCAFNANEEREIIIRGGPWLFNGYLLAMAEADGTTKPEHIPLLDEGMDDLSKPYRRWFQLDTFGLDCCCSKGPYFGFPNSLGWSMHAPEDSLRVGGGE
ncbi:unnamed protein product, partial [Prunus brigantina]